MFSAVKEEGTRERPVKFTLEQVVLEEVVFMLRPEEGKTQL